MLLATIAIKKKTTAQTKAVVAHQALSTRLKIKKTASRQTTKAQTRTKNNTSTHSKKAAKLITGDQTGASPRSTLVPHRTAAIPSIVAACHPTCRLSMRRRSRFSRDSELEAVSSNTCSQLAATVTKNTMDPLSDTLPKELKILSPIEFPTATQAPWSTLTDALAIHPFKRLRT